MFCLSNLCINKTVVAQKSDPSPEQTNVAPQPSLHPTKTITHSSSNKLRHRPPHPSVIQIERVVGAGSFRDGEPRHALPSSPLHFYSLYLLNRTILALHHRACYFDGTWTILIVMGFGFFCGNEQRFGAEKEYCVGLVLGHSSWRGGGEEAEDNRRVAC